MSEHTYALNDGYPNLQGVVSYKGSVDTLTMTGVLWANNLDSGPFTGAIGHIGGSSEDPSSSTFYWDFLVDPSMTAAEGVYKLCLKLTHSNGSIETVDANLTVKVVDRC